MDAIRLAGTQPEEHVALFDCRRLRVLSFVSLALNTMKQYTFCPVQSHQLNNQ